jgi:hypothetical protein
VEDPEEYVRLSREMVRRAGGGLELEALSIRSMENGSSCVRLTERISWDQFPEYARRLSDVLGAEGEGEYDLADGRIRDVVIDGCAFSIVWEDLPVGVSLEPRSDEAATRIPELARALREMVV